MYMAVQFGTTISDVLGLAMKPSEASVRIRRAQPEDANEVARVLRESFLEYQDRYTPEGYTATTPGKPQVRSRMEEGPTWVALLGDVIIGTASAVQEDAGLVYVRGMAVLPAARGQGVGKLLLRKIEDFAVRNESTGLLLNTTPFLESAIRLYERFGFVRTPDGPHDLFGTPLFSMAKALDNVRESDEGTRKENSCRRTTDSPPAFA
jgi:ribosomal protein S18 acetylase RimI-like enzyme